jgi:hypothetical protein
MSLWSKNRHIETKFQSRDNVLWFLKVISAHVPKFQRRLFGPYRIQYYLLNNMILLVIIDKFDPNLVLVNINKLKLSQPHLRTLTFSSSGGECHNPTLREV